MMREACFTLSLIIESPPERLNDLLTVLSSIKKELMSEIGCKCHGDHHIFVCACSDSLVKSIPVTEVGVNVRTPRFGGIPMVKLIINSIRPESIVSIYEIINKDIRKSGFKVMISD